MGSPKLSFVVPVFNGEKYLPRLISSFEKQTYQNLEFVFVDDASFDSTQTILLNFKARDPRVVYYRFDINQGTFVARATGFKITSGDIISCVDADDAISPNFAEAVVSAMIKNKADMCLSKIINVYENGQTEPINSIFKPEDNDIIKNGEGFDRFFSTQRLISEDIYSWSKVVSRALYKKCQPDIEDVVSVTKTPLSGGEDLFFTALFAINSKQMTRCTDATYYYYRYDGQSTATTTVKKYEVLYSSCCKILHYIELYLKKIKKFDKYAELYKGWKNTYNNLMQQDAMKLDCKRLYYKIAYEHNLIEKKRPVFEPGIRVKKTKK